MPGRPSREQGMPTFADGGRRSSGGRRPIFDPDGEASRRGMYGGQVTRSGSSGWGHGEPTMPRHAPHSPWGAGSGPEMDSEPGHYAPWHEPPAGAPATGRFRGIGPKGYRRADQRICDDVCDRLADDPHLDASEIEVRVENGEVILEGKVPDRDAKYQAEWLAESISGVSDVRNLLRAQRR